MKRIFEFVYKIAMFIYKIAEPLQELIDSIEGEKTIKETKHSLDAVTVSNVPDHAAEQAADQDTRESVKKGVMTNE